MDSHRLHMKVFPLLLADDARQWWIDEGDGKIITWKEPVEKFFYKFYPLSGDGEDEMRVDGTTKKEWMKCGRKVINESWNKEPMNDIVSSDEEWEESNYGNLPNTTTDSLFKPSSNVQEKNDIEKKDERSQKKRKGNIAEKFEAIKYSLGSNEEYIAIRSCEYNAWERNEDSVSYIYQDIFLEKGQGVDRDTHHEVKESEEKDLTGKEIDKVGEVSIIWNPMCVVAML
ncbi:hypothetical protein Tco_1230991, partial [Tanacetum coccineum]